MNERARDELVRQAKSGDAEALQCLLVHYHATLHRAVQRAVSDRLRTHIDPDDVLQQAYIAAFQHLSTSSVENAGHFYKWLEQVALNQLKGSAEQPGSAALAQRPR